MTCNICQKKFKYKGAFKSHLIVAHPNGCSNHQIEKYCDCLIKEFTKLNVVNEKRT